MKTFSIRAAVGHGWEIFKRNKRTLVASTFVIMVVGAVQNLAKHSFPRSFSLSSLIIWAAIYIVSTIVQIGWIKLALKLEDGEPATVRELIMHSKLFLKYFLTSLGYLVMMVIGFILLVIPGLYVILTYGFAPIIAIDEHVTLKESFRLSKRIASGARWRLLGLYLVLAILNLVGAIPLLLGLFVTVPMTMIAYVHVYRTLLNASAEPQKTA